MGVFTGLKVFEIGGDVASAVAGQACAVRGAEVIKLEPPEGDPLRHDHPYRAGTSKRFEALNRGKKSVIVDSIDPSSLLALVKDADIIIESEAAAPSRHPIDWDEVHAQNPRTIMVKVTAFGPKGPVSGKHANDLVMQAFSGLMMSERKTRGDKATPDVIKSTRFSEYGTGLMVSIGISAALFHRARTGKGQLVETSLLQNVLMLQGGRTVENEMADASLAEARGALLLARSQGASLRDVARPPPILVNPFYRAFQTRDGAVFVGALTRGLRDKVRAALGTDLMLRDDPNWNPKDPAQLDAAKAKQAELEQRIKQKSTQDMIRTLEGAGVPTGEVVFPEDLADTPHIRANNYLIEVEHESAGITLQVAPPIRYGLFPDYDVRPAPLLGSHTDEVLSPSSDRTAS